VLRLDASSEAHRGLALFRACGASWGAWNADHDGAFLADGGAWSGECRDRPWADWLDAAAKHRPDGDGHVLLDSDGVVVARLVPGEQPTLPPTIAQSEAAPPEITDDTRAALAPATALPSPLAPADAGALLGWWIPTDAPPGSTAHVTFTEDDRWSGSDGCNGEGGRWRAGDEGVLLVAAGGDRTEIGCENIPVDSRMARAARAGLDGDVLVLVDRRGGELGRFDRAECQPDATASVREQTATLPQCDEDSASNGPDGGYGDTSDPPVVDAQTAAVQRDRFAALVGGDYDATVTLRCFCPQAGAPVRIEVRGGVIVRATSHRDDGERSEDVTGRVDELAVLTVDGIHAVIGGVAARSDGEVRAAYDDRGVPVVALVDHHRNAIDDEMDYEVSDVVVR
jgi:heat shock protein HslJ